MTPEDRRARRPASTRDQRSSPPHGARRHPGAGRLGGRQPLPAIGDDRRRRHQHRADPDPPTVGMICPPGLTGGTLAATHPALLVRADRAYLADGRAHVFLRRACGVGAAVRLAAAAARIRADRRPPSDRVVSCRNGCSPLGRHRSRAVPRRAVRLQFAALSYVTERLRRLRNAERQARERDRLAEAPIAGRSRARHAWRRR